MQFGNAEQIFPVFFGAWIVLGLFSIGFFFLNKNAQLKRKVWPPFVIATGILTAVAFGVRLKEHDKARMKHLPTLS